MSQDTLPSRDRCSCELRIPFLVLYFSPSMPWTGAPVLKVARNELVPGNVCSASTDLNHALVLASERLKRSNNSSNLWSVSLQGARCDVSRSRASQVMLCDMGDKIMEEELRPWSEEDPECAFEGSDVRGRVSCTTRRTKKARRWRRPGRQAERPPGPARLH